jgi:hypothetical protein
MQEMLPVFTVPLQIVKLASRLHSPRDYHQRAGLDPCIFFTRSRIQKAEAGVPDPNGGSDRYELSAKCCQTNGLRADAEHFKITE